MPEWWRAWVAFVITGLETLNNTEMEKVIVRGTHPADIDMVPGSVDTETRSASGMPGRGKSSSRLPNSAPSAAVRPVRDRQLGKPALGYADASSQTD